MDYELNKKLKDAGFPNNGRWGGVWNIPSLSELIEACGDDFSSLYKNQDKWIATSRPTANLSKETLEKIKNGGGGYGWIQFEEKTPEIAVANLYLKLSSYGK